MEKLKLSDDLDLKEKKNAIETSLIMGFFSTTAKFPITSMDEGMEVPKNLSELKNKFSLESNCWPEDYVSATKNALPVEDMDWRKKKGLERLFLKGEFLKDENNDQLPDHLNFKFIVPEDSSMSIIRAACNLAFRFGMETTSFAGPILGDETWDGNIILFESSEKVTIKLIEEENRNIVKITGDGKELEEFINHICENFPLLPDNKDWVYMLQNMSDSLIMHNLDGQIAYLNKHKSHESIDAYFSPKIEDRITEMTKLYPNVKFNNYKSLRKVYEKEYDIPWEVDLFKIELNKILDKLNSGDNIKIYGGLSEDKEVRKELKEYIEKELEERSIVPEEINIICSYKQGYSWIDEVILPKLVDENIDSIEIGFKPFLKPGETEWNDEDGATPSYHNLGNNDPDKWFDIPIRFLQELYPVDDLISEKLNIDRENIKFVAYEDDEDITYSLRAFSKDEEVFNSTYKARYSERPYLDAFPNMGKVHPSTSFIKVVVNDEEVLDKDIKTDLENIWDIYQGEVLNEVMEYIEKNMEGKVVEKNQPFFAQLRLEVDASEPDYRLPFREDQISSLNAFHEDMYFVGLDYFKNYGIKNDGGMLDAPGLILPVIRNRKGKPKFKITLYDQLSKAPCIKKGDKIIESGFSRDYVELYLSEIYLEEGKYVFKLNTNIDDEIVKNYVELLNNKILDISDGFSGVDKIVFETDKNKHTAVVEERKEIEKDLSILDIDLMENELIGYEDYMDIVSKLKRVEGIEVFKIAESYLGRDIYAIELVPEYEGYLSRTKRINKLPSEIINARHHANEVSSTNAALILLKRLLTEQKYEDLANKLNLVIVPMENVDGTKIHYELQKENPYWKLHVARFNAIGKEFYREHFKPHTIHTEAMGLTRLWEEYLPDIIVDNHGVPSHEWEQQFSGYTSPSYKGFWLPRSLLYGYFWIVTDEEYKSNYDFNKKMEDVIADKIAENEEITRWNKEWMDRFEKYAHGWMPKLFPADYYKNMINYWISFTFDPEHRYPSVRFPWITSVSYTSEVADETAQGEYLNLCARAHVDHDEATIEMLMNAKVLYESEYIIEDDLIKLTQIRHRPILV